MNKPSIGNRSLPPATTSRLPAPVSTWPASVKVDLQRFFEHPHVEDKGTFTAATQKSAAVSAVKPTEALRLEVSRAVDRINVSLYQELKGQGGDPALVGLLTVSQFAQLMPALPAEEQQAMLKELGLSHLSVDELTRGVKAFTEKLSGGLPADVKLNQASFAYAQQGRALNPAIPAGQVQQVDFSAGAEQQINSDVSKATDGNIPELFEPGTLSGRTAMLASVAHLEAGWRGLEFDPANTGPRKFRGDDGSVRDVDMLHSNEGDHRVLDGKGFQALYLENGSAGGLATVYVKPDEGQTLEQFIAAQGASGLRNIIGDLMSPVTAQTKHGAVRLPRTETTFKPDPEIYTKALQKLGLPRAAELLKGSVDELGATYFSKMETTEAGIKGSAVQTINAFESFTRPPEPVVFDGDRSMLQLVVKDGQILFFNPIVNPNGRS